MANEKSRKKEVKMWKLQFQLKYGLGKWLAGWTWQTGSITSITCSELECLYCENQCAGVTLSRKKKRPMVGLLFDREKGQAEEMKYGRTKGKW